MDPTLRVTYEHEIIDCDALVRHSTTVQSRALIKEILDAKSKDGWNYVGSIGGHMILRKVAP